MATLNYTQLTQYAQNAGFTGISVYIIAAIALAESGGNTQAVNKSDPYGGSYGVLQINGSHISGLAGSAIPLSCAYDPACSFQYAYGLSNAGTNFNAWSTYTSGAYLPFLKTPVGSPTGGTGLPGTSGLSSTGTSASAGAGSDPLSQISNVFSQLQAAIAWIANPTRILKVIAGLICIGGAIWIFAATPEAEKALKRVTTTVGRVKSPPVLGRGKKKSA